MESIAEQSREDKSKSSRRMTGWIETPQILSALLNFRKIEVGEERKSYQGQESVLRDGSCGILGPPNGGGFLKDRWKNGTIAPINLQRRR